METGTKPGGEPAAAGHVPTPRVFDGLTPRAAAAPIALCAWWALGHVFGIGSLFEDGPLSVLGKLASEFAWHLLVLVVMGLPLLAVGNLGPASGWRRWTALAAAIALTAPLAAVLRWFYLHTYGGYDDMALDARVFMRWYGRYGGVAASVTLLFELHRRESASIATMQRAEIDRVTFDRAMQAARLAVLRAQIEPHFLFNTLANVRRLYQTDIAAGRDMLAHLMRYLEVALPRMREERSTLGRELALVESFLEVQRIRMGRRLAYVLDVAPQLHGLEVPPMMLLTLVENAIKHGLNPLPEGGHIDMRAQRESEAVLRIEVADDGRGFCDGGSAGTGLANIRARLAAQYGDAAQLHLLEAEPRGVRAVLTLPARGAVAP
jgi:signal transduction histidine kinase